MPIHLPSDLDARPVPYEPCPTTIRGPDQETGYCVHAVFQALLEAFESADGKFVYWAKVDVAGIWRVSVQGGEETQALDVSTEGLWALTHQDFTLVK
jgi:hypothetical protein